MTTTTTLWAYGALGLLFWIHSLVWMVGRSRRRERLLGLEEHVLLGVVALMASAAWAVLLPIYGARWILATEVRKGMGRAEPVRAERAFAARPAQRAA